MDGSSMRRGEKKRGRKGGRERWKEEEGGGAEAI